MSLFIFTSLKVGSSRALEVLKSTPLQNLHQFVTEVDLELLSYIKTVSSLYSVCLTTRFCLTDFFSVIIYTVFSTWRSSMANASIGSSYITVDMRFLEMILKLKLVKTNFCLVHYLVSENHGSLKLINLSVAVKS